MQPKDIERADFWADAEPLLNIEGMCKFWGCGPANIWRKTATGELPAPIRFGGITRWNRAEQIKHAQKLMAARSR